MGTGAPQTCMSSFHPHTIFPSREQGFPPFFLGIRLWDQDHLGFSVAVWQRLNLLIHSVHTVMASQYTEPDKLKTLFLALSLQLGLPGMLQVLTNRFSLLSPACEGVRWGQRQDSVMHLEWTVAEAVSFWTQKLFWMSSWFYSFLSVLEAAALWWPSSVTWP